MKPHKLVLIVILLWAAWLRFDQWTAIEHNVDRAYPLWQALDTLENGHFPVTGQGTSVLFANPALTGYIFLPLVALTRSALGAYLLVMALNTLAVYLAYRAARAVSTERVALLAAGLIAVNPWIVEYSRLTWVQGLLPFFACALAALWWPVLTGERVSGRHVLLAWLCLTAYTQTYLLAFMAVLPLALLLMGRFRSSIFAHLPLLGTGNGASKGWPVFRPHAFGLAVFVVATSVYAAGLFSQWDTVQARLGEFGDAPRQLSTAGFDHAVRLVTGADYPLSRGMLAPTRDADLRQTLTQIGHGLWLAALVVGVVLVWRTWRHGGFILLVWWFVPIALMSYNGQPVHPFYLLIGLPAGAVLAAQGVWAAVDWLKRKAVMVVIGFLLFGVLMSINARRFSEETLATPGIDGLGALPLGVGLELGAKINMHFPEGGTLFADVDNWTLASLAGRTFASFSRDMRSATAQTIPAAGGLLVHSASSEPPIPLAALVDSLPLTDGNSIWLHTYPANFTPQPQVVLEMATEQGLTLRGYDWRESGGQVSVTLYWRVEGATNSNAAPFYAPFLHIFNAAGERVAIVDGEGISTAAWQSGDWHIHRLIFTPPAQPFSVEAGQYDSQAAANLIFVPQYNATIHLTPP